MPHPPDAAPTAALQQEQQAVLAAAGQLLQPLAQLCLAHGVSATAIEALWRQTLVDAALSACAGLQTQRLGSRVSAMTGLPRREVKRLSETRTEPAAPSRWLAGDLLTRWMTLPAWLDAQARPRPLPRVGPPPSFERLAAEVTMDVHPRTLLAELERLGLVAHDPSDDSVRILDSAFVPRSDKSRMLGFLGAHTGDHLRAAVANVLGTGSEHFEQALLADELSDSAMQQARQLVAAQWRHLLTTLGPQLHALMQADRAAGRRADQQLRVGLYSWAQAMPAAAPTGPDIQPGPSTPP